MQHLQHAIVKVLLCLTSLGLTSLSAEPLSPQDESMVWRRLAGREAGGDFWEDGLLELAPEPRSPADRRELALADHGRLALRSPRHHLFLDNRVALALRIEDDQDFPLDRRNNLGLLPADPHPFHERFGGLPLAARGDHVLVRTRHELSIGEHLDVRVEPRLLTASPGTHAADFTALYLRASLLGIALKVGIFELALGPEPAGGLIASTNAPPLPGLLLTSRSDLPLLHSALGRFKAGYTLRRLGASYTNPEAFWSLAFFCYQPWRGFALSLRHGVLFAGENDPRPTPLEAAREILGFIPMISQTAVQNSNKVLELGARLHPPLPFAPMLFFTMGLDDLTKRALRINLFDNAAYTGGFSLFTTRSTFSVTAHRLFSRFYRHNSYPYAYRQAILGLPEGPDSMQLRSALELDLAPGERITGALRYLRRNNADYRFLLDHVEQLTSGVPARAYLLEGSYGHELRGGLVLTGRGGLGLELDHGHIEGSTALLFTLTTELSAW